MKISSAVLILVGLIWIPTMSVADTIFLKNGRRVEAAECWEDDNLVLCKQFGAIIGYRKNDITIYQVSGNKPKEAVRIDESEVIGQYQLKITDKIQSMWFYDGNSSSDPAFGVARISFTIVHNGDIQDLEFMELSKDPNINIAAFTAVMKSLPYSSFPPELTVMDLKMSLVFTSEGIQ